MATAIPASGISLHGLLEPEDKLKPGSSSAILLNLNDAVLRDLRKASHASESLHFVTGNTPKLRIGSRTIDLTIAPDAFRNELFASSTGMSMTDLTFTKLITHRAELKVQDPDSSQDTSGSDAALAALQNSLATYEQEKQAKQTTITSSILPTPKNRFDAARQEKLEKKRGGLGVKNTSQVSSPLLGASVKPGPALAPTSAPASEDDVKMRAMKTPVIHLLAMKPATSEEVAKKTHIPKNELESLLQKVGRQADGKWQLTERAYRDLDVWKFQYPSQQDRQAAIDNAIKAYDRLRVGKDEKLWQMLLPNKDRDKGIVLSKLHLGAVPANRGLTPHYQPSPMPHTDGAADSKAASAANTPRLGATTPRPASSKGEVAKRLLSKDPKKARAVEEAKGKKRKEREAAASDREGAKPAKRQATKKTNPNIKSAEFVYSSGDDSAEDGPLAEKKPNASQEGAKQSPKSRPKAAPSSSSDSSDVPLKVTALAQKAAAKAKANTTNAKAAASPAAKPLTPGKGTAQTYPTTVLSAPNSQRKVQRSPQKPDSRPTVPSPLGAARPRVASDVSDRGAVGVQRMRQGAETPKGLGITNGARKRQDTATSADPAISGTSDKKTKEQSSKERQPSPSVKGPNTPKAALVNSTNHEADTGSKRKAEEALSQQNEGGSAPKHRKTDSASSQPQKPHPTARKSPEGRLDGSSSDSAASVLNSITYNQGVSLAERFRDTYYPAYTKLYDEQAAMDARGETVSKEERERLWLMHRRLEQMKREIVIASQRERGEE